MNEYIIIFQIFLSFLTLVLAFFGYRTFIWRQAVTKQIDHLSGLINDIQSNKIKLIHNTIYGQPDKGSNHEEYLTLFEIGNVHRIFKKKSKELKETAVVKYSDDNVFPFSKYVYHPLTPSKIADRLAMFVDSDKPSFFLLNFNVIDSKVSNQKWKFVEVRSANYRSKYLDYNIMYEKKQTKETFGVWSSDAKALSNYFIFSKHAYELEQEITNWFQKIGIKDVNIRKYDSFNF